MLTGPQDDVDRALAAFGSPPIRYFSFDNLRQRFAPPVVSPPVTEAPPPVEAAPIADPPIVADVAPVPVEAPPPAEAPEPAEAVAPEETAEAHPPERTSEEVPEEPEEPEEPVAMLPEIAPPAPPEPPLPPARMTIGAMHPPLGMLYPPAPGDAVDRHSAADMFRLLSTRLEPGPRSPDDAAVSRFSLGLHQGTARDPATIDSDPAAANTARPPPRPPEPGARNAGAADPTEPTLDLFRRL